MSTEVRNLQPQALWNNFEDLNAVPRPSKREERVIAFIKSFAQGLNLEYSVDKVGNVIVKKPASAGMENRTPIVLQAHLDMVHQKNGDTNFDFDTQGIQSYIDGDWVKAKGTTLGADNGMGVAAMMTVLQSNSIAHPPLEALFTIDEEAGMTGAHNLEPNKLEGQILLNLDTEDDDELSVGCAGGIDTTINWNYKEENTPADYITLKVSVRGLMGGHSGMDIIYGRGNANKILTRLLTEVYEKFAARLSYFQGGNVRNAIPREADAIISLPGYNVDALKDFLDGEAVILKDEFKTTDPNLAVHYKEVSAATKVMDVVDQQKIILALSCCHDGIKRLSPDVDDLVETSNNLSKVTIEAGKAEILTLQRSDRESGKTDMARTVAAPFKLIGANVEHSGSYPGWKLDPNSEMLQVMKNLYIEMFNEQPQVKACHAGLECGLIGQHYPNMHMISFGPTIRHPHSPDEKVSISSVQKFWKFFQEALKRIPVNA